ncbi:MAG: TAXI family TRAP transporter solute-binding subunit [Bradyrhizobium sp.]
MLRIIALSLFTVLFAVHPAAAQTEVLLGADNPGGSYYLYGGGISNWVNEHSKTLRITSQTTRGSVENARLLTSGRLEFGLVNAIATYQQRHGTGQFEGQQSDRLRGIATLDSAPIHLVTYPSTGIKTLADFAGRRVSIGAPGSGSATTANFLFPLAGLNDKVTIQNLGFSESASNLRDGNVDAFMAASALPLPAVVDLASTHQIVLLDIPPNLVAELHKESPFYQAFDIPAGTYAGVNKPVHSVAVSSLLLARADTPDGVVTELLNQMYSKDALDYMRNVYRAWDPKPGDKLFADIEVPLHPAALKYYKAHGMIK